MLPNFCIYLVIQALYFFFLILPLKDIICQKGKYKLSQLQEICGSDYPITYEALATDLQVAGHWDLCTVPESAQVNAVNVSSLESETSLQCDTKLIVQCGW